MIHNVLDKKSTNWGFFLGLFIFSLFASAGRAFYELLAGFEYTAGYTNVTALFEVFILILAGIFLIQRKPYAVDFTKVILAVSLILSSIAVYGGFNDLIGSVIYSSVWLTYLYKSENVKRVYGKLKQNKTGYQIWTPAAISLAVLSPFYGFAFSVLSLHRISKNRKLKGLGIGILALIISILAIQFYYSDYGVVPESIDLSCNDYCINNFDDPYYFAYHYSEEEFICECYSDADALDVLGSTTIGLEQIIVDEQPRIEENVPAVVETNVNIIDACSSGTYIGDEITVEGYVAEVFRSGSNTVFINFDKSFPDHCFTAVIFSDDVSKFSSYTTYARKNVQVTGKIQYYEGKPEIVLTSPTQIEIV